MRRYRQPPDTPHLLRSRGLTTEESAALTALDEWIAIGIHEERSRAAVRFPLDLVREGDPLRKQPAAAAEHQTIEVDIGREFRSLRG